MHSAPATRDHPNPTFARASWTSLDGAWGFALGGPDDDPTRLSYDRTIEVPFPPESPASGIGLSRCDHPRYRRSFAVDAAGGRVLLHFEAVDYRCRVWVNGHLVAAHEGGHTPFVCDVTDALVAGDNELVVAADDLAHDLEQPRGKQDWRDEPHVIWYGRSSGIWRSVWLEVVPAVRVASLTWTPRGTDGVLDAEIRLHGDARGHTVECTFRCGDAVVGRARHLVTGNRLRFATSLGSPRTGVDVDDLLWTPERPTLIDVAVRLLDGRREVDAVASYTGLRTIGARNGAIELNGHAYPLRLVLEQAYWPETHFTAPSASGCRDEAELIKALGFNGLRMHQTTADPRFLRWCDELGLVVWADAPAAYEFSPEAFSRASRAWIELIERDRNHPSVIGWVPYNESWGVPGVASDEQQRWAVRALRATAKALDPTRLALGNDGWEHVSGDVVGIHDYSHNPAELRARYGTPEAVAATLARGRVSKRQVVVGEAVPPGVPVVLSEFGGFSLDSDAGAWKGYGGVADADALVARLADLVPAVAGSSGLAGYCYTQLTDTAQEQNGLALADRTPKAPAERLAAIFSGGAASS